MIPCNWKKETLRLDSEDFKNTPKLTCWKLDVPYNRDTNKEELKISESC